MQWYVGHAILLNAHFREETYNNMKTANYLRRGIAAFIDFILTIIFYNLVLNIFGVPDWKITVYNWGNTRIVLDLTLLTGVFFYYAILDSSAFGGSLGKQIMKIIVVDDAGLKMSGGRSAFRALVKILLIIPFIAGILGAMFTKGHRSLYDIICKTSVILKSSINADNAQ